MGKTLSDMTLEELWQLFPIFLTPHQDVWKDWYQEEAAILQTILSPSAQLHHIGSTAVPSIWAKPIIDILVEVEEGDLERVRETLVENGYRCMSQSPRRVSLNKGYTEDGFAQKVFHIHVRCQGDHDELYFRDYLTQHPQVAREYETLKLGLWKQFEHDRDGYTKAKTDFVQRYTQKAKGFPAPCLDIWQECDKIKQLKTMAEPKSHQRPKARGESESPRQVRFLCATPFRLLRGAGRPIPVIG